MQHQTTVKSLVGVEVMLMKTFTYAKYSVVQFSHFLYVTSLHEGSILTFRMHHQTGTLTSVPICKRVPSKAFKKV